MSHPSLASLLSELESFQIVGERQVEITGIAWDYEKVAPGCLYFCIEDEEFLEDHIQTNSLDYYQEAIKRGAVAIVATTGKIADLPKGIALVETDQLNKALALISKAFYQDPFHKMKMIGITGTNGKTTTSQLLDAIFQYAKSPTGIIGTIGTFYPTGKVSGTGLSNPKPTELFPIGQRMALEGVEHLVMEVTSHALAFERNHALEFDVAIFTNLSQDHLDFHGTFTEYKKSKLKHFQVLGQGVKKAHAVINLDDPVAEDFIEAIDPRVRKTGKVQILTYSIRNAEADLVAYPVEQKGGSSKFEVKLRGQSLDTITLPMAGLFNIHNALAAIAASLCLGVALEDIVQGLESSRSVEGRFERLKLPAPFSVYVDYAHTPDGLEKILTEVKNLTTGRVLAVFGCGGDRDRIKRPIMGKIAAQVADLAILTADNPRSEPLTQINKEVTSGVAPDRKERLIEIVDRKEAIFFALGQAKAGDAVVIAGKGHETTQHIGSIKYPFSDRQAVFGFFKNYQKNYSRARLEIDLVQLAKNWKLVYADVPEGLKILHVVKDTALGIGTCEAAEVAIKAGVDYLGVACMEEALLLKQGGINACPILVFGERSESDLETVVQLGLSVQVHSFAKASKLNQVAAAKNKTIKVHFKVDTGMGRYGVHWHKAAEELAQFSNLNNVEVEGLMTHFAQSDEADKTFVNVQIDRFNQVIGQMKAKQILPTLVHACNTGGYLDLPHAHYDMVRVGILPTGVYPSKVCRKIKIEGKELKPLLTLKAKLACVKDLQIGDNVGYGMHFHATKPTKIAVIAMGYGDGYPRLRNIGHVLIAGEMCKILGGNSMDAMMVDVSHLPKVKPEEEAILLGKQGDLEITAMMLADWAKTVTYDIMARWTNRLERLHQR
ncbi:MAG: UDP-N-acetylmuramoyl-L-alanyl-D-glutamate--2,6-diaminopimelate ligase [SAR324 cluster bacterium]|nr:UDP-N-acetylmuramoyl-L-alanyl-D-glutamate--2,6-diaminopimelate ligase [SAR324 cluster bacterium]